MDTVSWGPCIPRLKSITKVLIFHKIQYAYNNNVDKQYDNPRKTIIYTKGKTIQQHFFVLYNNEKLFSKTKLKDTLQVKFNINYWKKKLHTGGTGNDGPSVISFNWNLWDTLKKNIEDIYDSTDNCLPQATFMTTYGFNWQNITAIENSQLMIEDAYLFRCCCLVAPRLFTFCALFCRFILK